MFILQHKSVGVTANEKKLPQWLVFSALAISASGKTSQLLAILC